MECVFAEHTSSWKSLDYVAAWFMKSAIYSGQEQHTASALVSTNSICQGQQVPILWPLLFRMGAQIFFAHTSFKWANLATHNAGVTVAIIGLSREVKSRLKLFETTKEKQVSVRV